VPPPLGDAWLNGYGLIVVWLMDFDDEAGLLEGGDKIAGRQVAVVACVYAGHAERSVRDIKAEEGNGSIPAKVDAITDIPETVLDFGTFHS
jgi:hypothetical protein